MFIISQPVFITTEITFLPQSSLQEGCKWSNTFFLPAAELTIISFLLTWSNQLAKPNKCASIQPSKFKTGLNMKPGQDVNSQDPANGSNSLTQGWVLNTNWPIIRVRWAHCTNGDIKACVHVLGCTHQHLWGLFTLFWNNLDIKSSQTSLPSCDLSPMKCSQILPWQSLHPGGCFPQYAPVLEAVETSKKFSSCPLNYSLMWSEASRKIIWPKGKFLAFINRVCTGGERWASDPYCSTKTKLLSRQSMFILSLRLKGNKLNPVQSWK